ncbi:cupin domain-containing protein [bacterium]|nr:MAG: cupin domain-containing protein [bacterium]
MATTKIEGGKPFSLRGMVAKQEGSIVSRILLQDETGTLTVFAFDAGQALSEHTVPFNAFIEVIEGEAVITVGGKPSTVKEGEIILMPGGVPHKVDAVRDFKMLLIMFKTPKT